MKIGTRFFGTRVARRILLLFIASAILPVVVLATISYVLVANQLNDQSRARLRQATKAVGMSSVERLQLIESDLIGIARATLSGQSVSEAVEFATVNAERFSLVEYRDYSGLTGLLTEPQFEWIRGGGSVIVMAVSNDRPIVVMVRAIDPGGVDRGFVWSEVETLYLWGLSEAGGVLPPDTEFCAFGPGPVEVYCTNANASAVSAQLVTELTTSPAGTFEWRDADDAYVAGYWSVFLRAVFAADDLTLVLSESRASVLLPMANFKFWFLFTVLMALWAVLLLSNVLIRKSMDPLRRLQEGTRHIAQQEFGHPVDIQSGDEFEELGESFNAMARQLDRQFRTLESRSDIDRAVLSTLESGHIYETVLTRANQIFTCDSVSIAIVKAGEADAGWRLITQHGDGERLEGVVRLSADETAQLADAGQYSVVRAGETLYDAIRGDGAIALVLFPLFVKRALAGAIVLRYHGAEPPTEDLRDGRQLSDQVAVALSNTHLVEELDELNWGALTALARAIDAKSTWTAGHSERVTQMSLAIAKELGLDEEQYNILHRGGLLHDIGKIGIPAAILDKPGPLTPEENAMMRRHPEIGATILEPMVAYAHAIPIVLYHHERLDGTGYPHGLSGTEIPFLARLLAVADVFDALTSERPYRASWPLDEAVSNIVTNAGSHFDPEMVEPFKALMIREPERWGQQRDRVQSVMERGA